MVVRKIPKFNQRHVEPGLHFARQHPRRLLDMPVDLAELMRDADICDALCSLCDLHFEDDARTAAVHDEAGWTDVGGQLVLG
jgi:hypothetical protein